MMLRLRLFEEKIVEVYPVQDMKCPVHLYIGEEAVASGVCAHLDASDYVWSTHRSHGHSLAKGMDMKTMMAEFYGRVDGSSHGWGGSMHLAAPEIGLFGTSAIVAGGLPLALGTALASHLRRDGRITAVFFGDGAADEGTLFECMNFAALKKLPLLFVCENNFYATNSRQDSRQPLDNIAERGSVFGIPGAVADGNDIEAVYKTAEAAAARARAGQGPSLLEFRTFRWKGHVGPDNDCEKGCRPQPELDEWLKKCPIERQRSRVRNELGAERLEADEARIKTLIDEAVEFGRRSPWPTPSWTGGEA